MEDSELNLYNRELIALAEQAATPRRLAKPDVSARALSPICGSAVIIELSLQGDTVRDFGYDVEACALTKSVVAIMAKAIVGKRRDEISRAGAELRAMLSDPDSLPAGDWAALKILAPVRDYKARHNAILLPFEAVEKAFAETPPTP